MLFYAEDNMGDIRECVYSNNHHIYLLNTIQITDINGPLENSSTYTCYK